MQRFLTGEALRQADDLLARSARLGVTVITPDESDYPARLRDLPDPPPAVWCRGTGSSHNAPTIAIVGSRRPTPYGEQMAERFSRELATAGATIVSGLARGIDGIAHRAALAAGGQTIAVLGCGIDRAYPAEHSALQEAVSRQGLVVTEFPLGSPPKPYHFPQRNRLISALSVGVIVVEAGERSGSLITARLALDQGREVFAVPGLLGSAASIGTNRLIKSGATLVEHAGEILDAVAPQLERRPRPTGLVDAGSAPEPLTGDEGLLAQQLSHEPRHMDELSVRSGRPVQHIAALLLALELKGAVRHLPGNFYVKMIQ